jgi:hypothetical protein
MRAVLAQQMAQVRAAKYAHVELRGLIMSHLIGLCVFIQLVVDRGIRFDIPYNRGVDIPIRLIAIWLLLDRVGRYRRIKATGWDWAHLGFLAFYGFALVYAELMMTRESGFLNYVNWISSTFQAYIFFLVIREASSRRGFNPTVLVRWVVWTLAIACVIAMFQALDFAGTRSLINDFYNQRAAEAKMQGPSAPWQARGPMAHANAMASLLIMGSVYLVVLAYMKKLRWWDYGIGLLLVGTLFATYSRLGVVSGAVLCLAVVLVIFLQRKYYAGGVALFGYFALVAMFIAAVFIFDVQRYKVLIVGEGTVRNNEAAGIMGWYLRRESIERAVELASRYPITGVNVATSALNQEMIIYKSAYTFEGLLLNVYAFTFVSYGAIGLLFLGGVLWLTLSQVYYVRKPNPYAAATFLSGVAIAVLGIAENTLFFLHGMILVNVLVGLCFSHAERKSVMVKRRKVITVAPEQPLPDRAEPALP